MFKFMVFITNLGSPLSVTLLSVGLIGLLWIRGKKIEAKDFFRVMLAAAAAVLLLKYLVARPRPPITTFSEIGPSFPSAHATLSLVFFLCIAYFFERHISSRFWKTLFILLNIAIVALVSISRVYLGVHYVSDVIGGLVLGLLIFVFFVWHRRRS